MRLLLPMVFLVACGDGSADDWNGVRNPILGFPDVAIKDAYAVHDGDTWQLGYSRISDNPFRVQLGFASSADLRSFQIGATIDQPDTGGLASPTVVRAPDGRWIMTYNSHTTDVGDALSKLYYRSSTDLATWSDAVRIHIGGVDDPSERLIDAAVAFADAGAFLFFKRDQIANVAYSQSGSIDGPWTLLGELSQGNLENYEPILIDGTWYLLGTTIPLVHDPVLHRLDGDPLTPASWQTWTVVRTLDIAEQSWNTGAFLDHERANAAYLLDDRAHDGFFYLVYAGSTDLSSFQGRGHSQLGIARSTDLETWDVAPEK